MDFIEKPLTGNKSEAELLPWWHDFVGSAESIAINTEKKFETHSALKLKSWFERMIPTLYVIRYGLGIDINDEINHSEWRLTARHRRRLEVFQTVGKEDKKDDDE